MPKKFLKQLYQGSPLGILHQSIENRAKGINLSKHDKKILEARKDNKTKLKLQNKNKDFKRMKKGDMTKEQFIRRYPDSITARKARGGKPYYSKKETNQLKNKNKDFQRMKRGEITKAQFIRRYPDSITARNSKKK